MDLLSSILDQMDDAFVISEPSGKILYYNKAFTELGNSLLNQNFVQGDPANVLLKKLHKGVGNRSIEEVIQNKKALKSFAEFTGSNSLTYYLEFTYTPVLDETGVISYIHIYIRETTQQKIFEKKLTTLAADISNLTENANAIIIGLDTRGYVTSWNKHCTKTTGFEKNEIYAQRFADVLLESDQKSEFESLMSRVLQDKPVDNTEITIQTKEGESVIFLLNSTVRKSATGAIIGVVMVGQDVTELIGYRNSLERQVEERTRELHNIIKKEKELVDMKSRFVSIASHEFRTPLSSIQHVAEFIKKNKNKIDSLQLDEKLNSIEKQIKHMTHLLDDVLSYSKSEAGKIQLITSNIVLRDFVEKLIEDVGHSTKHTHTVKLELLRVPESITTDEKLLRSILINLLTNAIKYSPKNNQVVLGVDCTLGKLIFTVQDFGMGIPDEEKEKLFDPFIRGKSVGSIQGTGLGLSIVKKAISILNGNIAFKSQLGEGTTFTVTVPEHIA
jgi:PAS domain S-box-containing protein